MGSPKSTFETSLTRRRLDEAYREMLREVLVPGYKFRAELYPDLTAEQVATLRWAACYWRTASAFGTSARSRAFPGRRPAHRSLCDEASPGQEAAIRVMEDARQ